MQLQISGHQLELTQAIHDYAFEKINNLKPAAEKVTNAHVILTTDGNLFVAEAQLNLPGKPLHATAEAADLYEAIDALHAKLNHLLIKYKEKRLNHQE